MKPDTTCKRLLRCTQVQKIIPFSRSYIYELMAQGRFPASVKLIPGGRGVGWWEHEINALAEQRHQETRGGDIHE